MTDHCRRNRLLKSPPPRFAVHSLGYKDRKCAMKIIATGALLIFCLCSSVLLRAQESLPAFCEPLPNSALGRLAVPYAKRIAPDGSVYGEGLWRTPIALPPPRVVSLKQQQDAKPKFSAGSKALLNWCDDSGAPIHIALRSVKSPMFALDALHNNQFEWSADLIAQWQPDWNNIAVRGTRELAINGQNYEVVVPLRMGSGYSSKYSFMVQAKVPVSLSIALIEPVLPASKPEAIKIVSSPGPVKNTWITTIPFSMKPKGVYRVTLEESVEQAGVTTEPVYLLHGGCQ